MRSANGIVGVVGATLYRSDAFYHHLVSIGPPGSGVLGEFISPAALRPPRFISPQSAWNEHIPFAGWIIEALRPRTVVELGVHTGVSYFAFCEAVLNLNLGPRCFAVDHWLGDQHSGRYGEEVFEAVSMLNERYRDFSTLLRMTFDEATAEFQTGEIDLLHIDGLHTYEAVQHDFEAWLPKISNSSVVLLHDTAERKKDFGVHRLLAELRERFQVFEFSHGHGLGVVATGGDLCDPVHRLVSLDGKSPQAQLVRDLYSALGARVAAEVRLGEVEGNLPTGGRQMASGQVEDEPGELAALRSALGAQAAELEAALETASAQGRMLTEMRATLSAMDQRMKDLHRSTSWRVTRPLRLVGDWARPVVWRLRAARDPSTDDEIQRLYSKFDRGLDRETRRDLRTHLKSNPHLRERLVSIVMPTHNRGYIIGEAIKSVLRQTHEAWELLVVDDGSADDTEGVVRTYQTDERIRYLRLESNSGVGPARNEALAAARGEWVAYLDSDNRWDREFLALMIAGLDLNEAAMGYSATEIVEGRKPAGYRGDRFDFERCMDANYIDINSFVHRRDLLDGDTSFDPTIRRTSDWDFILRLTYGRDAIYLPFIGAHYSSSDRADQITFREPYVFRNLVEARHRRRYEGIVGELETFEQTLDHYPLRFAIRTAAPHEERELWGDHHFAVALASALERLEHKAHVYYLDEELTDKFDVVLVLRGLTEYEPSLESVNVIWNISHPDRVSFDELEEYDIVFVGSSSYQKMVSKIVNSRALPLLQATDRDRFHPYPNIERDSTLLFVGNSRNVDRRAVRYALEAGLPLVIHGSGWEGRVPSEVIRSTYLPNEETSRTYAGVAGVLNDHWESMRDFGFISNRIFDALASGATVISDTFPELERFFGSKIHTFTDKAEFIEAAQRVLTTEPDSAEQTETAHQVLEDHSFDTRAEAIVTTVHQYLGASPKWSDDEVWHLNGIRSNDPAPFRIGIIPQMPVPGRWSSSAYIRLIQPLTSDLDCAPIEIKVVEPQSVHHLEEMDLVIVSRTALSNSEAAKMIIDRTGDGSRLAVDIDDAFHLMDESHPQYDEYRDRVDALERLMDASAMVWCSTEPLKESLGVNHLHKATVIPNTIDPRLWRRYRKGVHTARTSGLLEILYMGSVAHAPDLNLVISPLEQLAHDFPGSFRLTVIGLDQTGRDPEWIRRLPPDRPDYPNFARWLRDLAGEFDVGLAPLADSKFNRMKSDIKVLEYTALGLPVIASPVGPYRNLKSIDLCDSPDDWYELLASLTTDRARLDERRISVDRSESIMWRQRRSAIAGQAILRMSPAHVH
jgi:glycosyltransferase involved in cell wall biosynthesis